MNTGSEKNKNPQEYVAEHDNRPNDYSEANDRITYMTDLEKCLQKLESMGYKDHFRVEKKHLQSLTEAKRRYKPKDIMAVNLYRFEGITDPGDMSILYAIETSDGHKGTLIDAYGNYSDDDTGAFMQEVDISKRKSASWAEL